MVTSIFKITFKNGAIFHVFCANSTQQTKILRHYNALKDAGEVTDIVNILNGIHTAAQFIKMNPNGYLK